MVNSQKIRRLLPLFMLGLAFCLMKEVQAENGQLVINNQVIYEKNKEKKDSIEYRIAPDLFLAGKTESDKQISAKREYYAKQAKEKVFVTNHLPNTAGEKREYAKQLFLNNYEDNVVHIEHKGQQSSSLPKSLMYFFAGLAVVAMLGIGILLGRKFSNVFVRKNG